MALCSFAVAAGVIGLVALAKRLVFRRRFGGHAPWAYAACGPSFAAYEDREGEVDDDGHRAWRGARRRYRGPGRSFWLRGLFARLDTTPGQEREIRAALEELETSTREAKDGLKAVREDLARAIRADSFDEIAAGEARVRANVATSAMKDAFEAALKRVHAVLDSRQRERLADLLENGPGFGRRWGNPYRDAAL